MSRPQHKQTNKKLRFSGDEPQTLVLSQSPPGATNVLLGLRFTTLESTHVHTHTYPK